MILLYILFNVKITSFYALQKSNYSFYFNCLLYSIAWKGSFYW